MFKSLIQSSNSEADVRFDFKQELYKEQVVNEY